MIHTGDCIEVMRTLPADSVDAVVTDPPYGIRFMGKAWDGADIDTAARRDAETRKSLGPHSESRPGRVEPRSSSAFGAPSSQAGAYDFSRKGNVSFQEWCEAWGTEALRVTKPGGYLLAFGGTRTHHRLVCGLEDAGWIIRDELTWVYASGFPKGKANLKPAHEPIVLARKPGPLRPLAIDECRIPSEPIVPFGSPAKSSGGILNGTGESRERYEQSPGGRWPSNLLLQNPELFDEPNPYVVGSGATDAGGGFGVRGASTHTYGGGKGFTEATGEIVGYGDSGGYSRFFKIPDRSDRWSASTISDTEDLAGPLSGADSAEGSSSTDRSIGTPTEPSEGKTANPIAPSGGLPETYPRFFIVPKSSRADREPVVRGTLAEGHAGVGIRAAEPGEYDDFVHPAPEGIGGWLREQREAAGLSAKDLCGAVGAHGAVNHGGAVSNWEQEMSRPTPDQWRKLREVLGFDDRYDDVMTTTTSVDRKLMDGALPARRENAHPTVKPVDLMRHLIRLVTPSGGTVLDCFAGSGSTLIAAELEGYPWIGIEQDAGYVAIAEARLNGTQRGLGLDVPA